MTHPKRFIKNASGYHSHGKTHKEKIFNFGVYIKQFGWEGSWSEDEESAILKATMTRGDSEKIEIEWPETQWWPDVWYTFGGESIKCRNISMAAKIAADKPDAKKMRRTSRRKSYGISGAFLPGGSNNGSSEDAADDLIAAMSTTLPFDKESTPEEIKAVLKAHRSPTITWINRISGDVNTDIVKTWSRHLKVTTNKDGKKIIHFIGHDCFHAVYADSIIGIS